MKLLFRNQAYRLLTLSRFFNAFGASIFNLVFIVYASTLPPLYSRGVLGKYAHIVSSASRGAVTDFWNMDKSGKK